MAGVPDPEIQKRTCTLANSNHRHNNATLNGAMDADIIYFYFPHPPVFHQKILV